MDLEVINIVLKANTASAEAGLQKVEKTILGVGDAAANAAAGFKPLEVVIGGMPQKIIAISAGAESAAAGFSKLQQQVASFGGGVLSLQNKLTPALIDPLKKLPATANRAGLALTDLGRIAQDAPFGFIAIQNNITPLIESFGRLKAETGSTGGALKAMAGSLSGPAGIGLAIGLATLAFTLYSKFSKKATQDTDDFSKALRDAEKSATATGIKLQSYVSIAKDGQQPLAARNEALKEANKLMGDHGKELTLVNINTAEATKQVEIFTRAIIAQAVATKYADKLADLTIKQNDASKAYAKTIPEFNTAYAASLQKAGASASAFTDATTQKVIAAKQAWDKTKDAADAYKSVTKELTETTGDYNKANEKALSLLGQLGHKDPKDPKGAKATGDTIAKILKDLSEAQTATGLLNDSLGVDKTKERIGQIENAITRLIKINVAPEDKLIQKLLGDRAVLQLPQTLSDFGAFVKKKFGESIEKAPFEGVSIAEKIFTLSDMEATNSLNKMRDVLKQTGRKVFSAQGILSDVNLLNDAEVKKNFENINEQIETTSELVSKYLFPAFDAVFDSIATGQNAFAALGHAVKQLITQLIKAVAEAAILALILNVFFPGSSKAAGGFAGIFKNLVGIPNAAGGVYTSPTLALVGEAGPERITPLNSITNANRNSDGGDVVFQISGNALRGVLRRANDSADNIF